MIRSVSESELDRVRGFLEKYADTSLFLLSTLSALGPRLGEHPNSGNFHLVEEGGRIVAVFCLTRRGNLLVQSGGRNDLSDSILEVCRREPVALRGVVGEWAAAEPIWERLVADPQFKPVHSLKDVLYRLDLKTGAPRASRDGGSRASQAGATRATPEAAAPSEGGTDSSLQLRTLEPSDFAQWEPLSLEYFREMQLPLDVTFDERRADFLDRVRSGLWWGAFDGRQLISIASLNATYRSIGQIGGVYTRPDYRRRGASRAVMQLLVRDCLARGNFKRLILFTGIDNISARRLYETVGFRVAGRFGLLLGARPGGVRE